MQWYLAAVKNYAGFSGRARRAEYWLYLYFSFLIVLVLYFLTVLAHSSFVFMLVPMYYLAMLVPSLAVLVRRLHDVGISGWWILIIFVPIAGIFGAIAIFVVTVLPGSRGPNRYGDNPKSTPMAAPHPTYPTYQ
jgi:uncharacterized membrane protein YhaH (DUF805 family)